MSRKKGLTVALAIAIIGGLLLFVTMPKTNLIDVPMNEDGNAAGETLDSTKTPVLSSFYDPGNWTPKAPGTLIKAEPIPGAPTGARAYRVMYESTDLQGNPIPVTGLYVAPTAAAPTGGYPLVSFAHGTTGVGQACGVSQTPFEQNTPSYSNWTPHIGPMVEQGWAVIASDYSGMGAPGPSSYLVGPLEGRGILDGLRAVQQPAAEIGSIPINQANLGIYGKSQGGEAALSAAQLQPSYAPELNVDGTVSLAPGFTPALAGILNTVAKNPTSTSQNMFVLLIAKSFAENYPDLVNLDDVLTPLGKEKIKLLTTECGSGLAKQVSDVPLSQLLNVPIPSGLVEALGKAMPGDEKLQQPTMIVQGLKDKTILPQFTHAQVMSQCALGSTVYYVRYKNDDHPSINYQAREHYPSVMQWMEDRWAGEPAPANCANQLLGTAKLATGVSQ